MTTRYGYGPLLALLALLALSACAPGARPAAGPETDGAGAVVAQRWREYAADLATADVAAVTANYAVDAQITEANRSVLSGRADIERNFRQLFEVMHLPATVITSEHAALEGDRIYDFGRIQEVVQLPGQQSWDQQARYAAVWRRGSGGWLIERLLLVPIPPAGS